MSWKILTEAKWRKWFAAMVIGSVVFAMSMFSEVMQWQHNSNINPWVDSVNKTHFVDSVQATHGAERLNTVHGMDSTHAKRGDGSVNTIHGKLKNLVSRHMSPNTHRQFDTGAMGDTQFGADRFKTLTMACKNKNLDEWRNSEITVTDFHETSPKPCHQMEVDMSSLMPIRDWNGNIRASFKNRRSAYINVCGISRCLYINETEKGLAQIMNRQNFDGVTCPPKNVSFNRNIKHHTALASFPRSGNTWTRHLLEYISGTFTGSVYSDKKVRHEFTASGFTEGVVVIKTHKQFRNDPKHHYESAVLLVRTPVDSILSFYNYKKTASHTKTVTPEAYNNSKWQKHVEKSRIKWINFYNSWLRDYPGRKMILSYKQLRQDFFNEVLRVSRFLNITLTYKTLWCANINKEGNFHRVTPNDMNKYSVYTDTMLQNIEFARSDVNQRMRDMFDIDGLI